MFFTWQACRMNFRPSPIAVSSQSRAYHEAHVRLMFAADASSGGEHVRHVDDPGIGFAQRHLVQDGSDVELLARRCDFLALIPLTARCSASRSPVTMFTTPGGTSDVSSTL